MVKKYLKLINNERKANGIMPMKACTTGATDVVCRSIDYYSCSWFAYDCCSGGDKDYSGCSGPFQSDAG